MASGKFPNGLERKKNDFLSMYCTSRIVKKDRLGSELEAQMLRYMIECRSEKLKMDF